MAPLPFETIHETWTEVKLEDGSIIRMKPVLLWLYRRGRGRKAKPVEFRIQLLTAVWSPKKGTPAEGEITPARTRETISKRNLSFKYLTHGESRYEYEGGQALVLGVIPTRFDKTSLFDRNGDPVYSIDSRVEAGPDAVTKVQG